MIKKALLAVLVMVLLLLLWRSGVLSQTLHAMQRWQGEWQRDLTRAVAALKRDNAAWWPMISAGFVYGILHAAGPGHGKAVVITFLASQQHGGYRSALWLALGGALLQALSAVFWVSITLGAAQWLIRETVQQTIWINRLSLILIAAVGLWIIWRQWKALRHPACQCCAHHHAHAHHHSDPASQKAQWLAMLSIGLRPCSGAIMALAVAASWGLWSAGIAMTFAMAAGTACTVLLLAILTVYGRERLLSKSASTLWQSRLHGVAMVGGMLLVFLAGLMLAASFTPNHIPLF